MPRPPRPPCDGWCWTCASRKPRGRWSCAAASERGTTSMVLRLKVLEFLDVTADTLTTDHFAEFVRPRIARWDVDLETGVLRVSLRSQEPRQRPRAPRAPASS